MSITENSYTLNVSYREKKMPNPLSFFLVDNINFSWEFSQNAV